MGSYNTRIALYLYITFLVDYGNPCVTGYRG
jgi:hypothetical protein